MTEVALYDRAGRMVEFVLIEPPTPGEGPEILCWGSRFFYRLDDRSYLECRVLQAYTPRELRAMGKDL
jgi:hypothetical protein